MSHSSNFNSINDMLSHVTKINSESIFCYRWSLLLWTTHMKISGCKQPCLIQGQHKVENFNNHSTTIMQRYYNSARCKHLAEIASTLSQPYKVVARLLQSSYFCVGIIQRCLSSWTLKKHKNFENKASISRYWG